MRLYLRFVIVVSLNPTGTTEFGRESLGAESVQPFDMNS